MIKIGTKRFKTHEKFCEEVDNLTGEEYIVLSTYIDAKEKILFQHNCKKCKNHKFFMSPSNFLKGERCPKCAGLHKTHEEFLEEVKNINSDIKTIGQYKKSRDTIKVKCLKCTGEWEPTADSLLRGSGCPYCTNQKILIGFNDIWTTNFNLAKLLVNIEDGYKYTQKSNQKLDWQCPNCGEIIKNKKISDINRSGLVCPKCSDGKSYPNKFMFNVLDQLNNLKIIEDFEAEKIFEWFRYEFKGKLRKGFLDFYFEVNHKKYGIEMDGSFHNKDNKMNGQTKEESKFIDDEKDRLCIKHDIEIIRINSDKSELEWIKNNIIQSELLNLLNFNESDIDWIKCHKYALSSLVKVVCDIWNSGIKNTKEISNITKISQGIVIAYLKQADKINLCNYNPKISYKYKYLNGYKSNTRKQVICIETGKTYDSIVDAGKEMNCNDTHISSCCKGKRKTCGKLEDGTKLHWEYVS
jgi:hypothetical protein